MYIVYHIIIISDLVDDRDQTLDALGNERINTKRNKYKEYKYFTILFCSFVLGLIQNQYNKIKYISQYQEYHHVYNNKIIIKYNKNI